MQKRDWTWATPKLPEAARLERWGHFGVPVLLFPTAGGGLEELERFGLIAALEPLIGSGRIKLYSVDGLPIRSMLRGDCSRERSGWQRRYDAFLIEELVPRIRQDCLSDSIEIALAGASLGALTAVGTLCRHPEPFRAALGLSGVYDLGRFSSAPPDHELDWVSPITLLPELTTGRSADLEPLRRRTVMLGSGEGALETPLESRRLATVLESAGVPHVLDLWGVERDHDWGTWRQMLPKYLERLVL